jgi:hypothetical protein
MKQLLRRIIGRGYGDMQALLGPADDRHSYPAEFLKAYDRTEALGCKAPPRILVQRNCLDMEKVEPALQKFFAGYTADDIAQQGFALNVNLVPYLIAEVGMPMILTIGWIELNGHPAYKHDDDFLRTLIRAGTSGFGVQGVPLHIWLTSLACEVLDTTFTSTLAAETGDTGVAGRLLYQRNDNRDPDLVYHPTVVGVDFLDQIGATIVRSGERH